MFTIVEANTLFIPFIRMIRSIDISANIYKGISVLNSKAQITEQDVAISDWDSIDTIGIYSGNSENGTKNAPVDHEWVTGIALRANGNSYFMNIIAIVQNNGHIYTRTMSNNVWGDWKTK